MDNQPDFTRAKRGIRVNAVAPGVIKTPMHPVETHAQLAKLYPFGRMGEICDIVGAILYLEAAGFSKIGHWRMGRRRGEE